MTTAVRAGVGRIVRSVRRRASRLWSGDASPRSAFSFQHGYTCWQDACADAGRYDAQAIVDKTLSAVLKVKSGQAVFERDSVLLPQPEYPFPLLTTLLHAATVDRRLDVLDIGGALGSSYFQCRKWLSCIPEVSWRVVDLARQVQAGQEYVADDVLTFHLDAQEQVRIRAPNVVLLSGVLQFVERPHEMLRDAFGWGCRWLVIDRLPLSQSAAVDRLCVMSVSADIFEQRLPYWVLSEVHMRQHFHSQYSLFAEWKDIHSYLDIGSEVLTRRGFVFDRVDSAGLAG